MVSLKRRYGKNASSVKNKMKVNYSCCRGLPSMPRATEDLVPRQQSKMNKGHPISMSVQDRPAMKPPQFHIRGGRREIKRSPTAAVLEEMMQGESRTVGLCAASRHRKLLETTSGHLYHSSSTTRFVPEDDETSHVIPPKKCIIR